MQNEDPEHDGSGVLNVNVDGGGLATHPLSGALRGGAPRPLLFGGVWVEDEGALAASCTRSDHQRQNEIKNGWGMHEAGATTWWRVQGKGSGGTCRAA